MEAIELDGRPIQAAVVRTGSRASDVTARPISAFDVTFLASEGEVSPRSATEGVFLGDGRRLRVMSSSYTVRDGMEHWTLHTEEVEMLAPEAVTIGEQMVVPQQYAESVRDGHREIEIIALSDSETARGLHALREARDTVQVVREGVNPDPVPMVVDNVKYADEEGGFYLAVRLESPDEIDLTSVPWTLDFFGASHLAAKAARARLRALTAMLEAKGVLTSEDMEQLDADSEMKLDEVGFEFNAVRRLSDCRLN